MADFLELGLEACDKAIDYGFDKLPDRIISPLGADIPHPHLFHRNKKGDLVNNKGEVQKDTASNREREYEPDRDGKQGGQGVRDRGVGDKPQRSKTMPPEYDGRPRRASGYGSDESDRGYRRDRKVCRRDSRAERNGYAPSQSRAIDPYAPNPDYGYNNAVSTRPPITSRRSQSYAPPRRRRDRSPTISSSSSGNGTLPPENKAEKLVANPYAAGAIGALTGGLLANQAGKATGLDRRRRSKSQSSGRGRFKKTGEGDEALVTLAGMVLGGVTAAFGSERYKKFRSRKYEESQLWEKSQNNDGRLAQEDWEREHHDIERKIDRERDSPVGGWARSQADVYPDQIREARKWQAQVEAGERERERTHRDDVVMVEDTRSRREADRPRAQKVYRQERMYQLRPEDVPREVVERIEEPLRYERRSRRRSVDDRSDRRREYDRDSGYGYETRPRERYVVSGGR